MGLTVFTSWTNPQIVIFHQKTWAESGIRIKCLGGKAVHRLHKRKEAGTWSREREATACLLGWTTRLTRPHFIMRIGMLLCHLSLCSSYIIVRGFKSLFYRRAVETKQYLCITVGLLPFTFCCLFAPDQEKPGWMDTSSYWRNGQMGDELWETCKEKQRKEREDVWWQGCIKTRINDNGVVVRKMCLSC